MDDLNAASLADVKDWFKTYYGPSNAVLVLAGDIDPATAKEKVIHYFGDIPSGPPVAHQEAWIAKMSGVHRQRVADRVPLPRVYMVWNTPQFGAADSDYLDLVARCLTEGHLIPPLQAPRLRRTNRHHCNAVQHGRRNRRPIRSRKSPRVPARNWPEGRERHR